MNKQIIEPGDRRPIQSRNTLWAAGVTSWLVMIGASPNSISVFGMVAAIGAGIAFWGTANWVTSENHGLVQRGLWLTGALLCQVRLLCNLFDGMVAVEQGTASPKGELYNEVPDRVSDSAVMIGLGYASGGDVILGFVAAILSVFVAYVRAMAKAAGAPNDFCGPMAKPQRMALVTVVAIYLAIAPSAWHLAWGEPRIVLGIIIAGCIVTAVGRLVRAARYLEANGS